MSQLKSFFLILSLLINNTVMAQDKTSSDAIGFPEREENAALSNVDNRQPVYLPSKCPPNELYYPGDQKDDWICDCRPAHLYHPGSDSCWPAFQRGPCAEKQYLILPRNTVIPVCENNPCINGYVLWNGKCERLGSSAPCGNMFPPTALNVNASTLVVGCGQLSFESRFGDAETVVSACPPGGKRSVKGKCVPTPL